MSGEASQLSAYNMIQRDYITLLTQSIFNLPVESIGTRLLDVQDNILKCGLSTSEQKPLLFAVALGTAAYNYWVDKVETPGDWEDFLLARAPYQASQYALIPHFVAATIEGALYGAHIAALDQEGVTVDFPVVSKWSIYALVTSLSLGSAKVIFSLVPRIQNNCA
ncbi:hypothetical protein BH09BAC1_BH09BAC1_07430 [soil metagenome]